LLFAIGNSGNGGQTISIQLALQHPYSQGRMYITTDDAFDYPTLDPHYLTHWADVTLMRQAVRLARKIAATSPLKDVLGDEVSPGLDVTSDDAIDAYVANDITTEFHPANTLAMLPRDQGGVVDARLRVYGLGNVRVVDASIFPLQFAAHVSFFYPPFAEAWERCVDLVWFSQMQWPVYSLAEHASELIRAFHNGVRDPDDPNISTGTNTNNGTDGNTNGNNSGNNSGGALSLSIPSVLTAFVALFFAGLTVVL